jgi:hypothetical protein
MLDIARRKLPFQIKYVLVDSVFLSASGEPCNPARYTTENMTSSSISSAILTDVLHGVPQSLEANAGIVTTITQKPLHSKYHTFH